MGFYQAREEEIHIFDGFNAMNYLLLHRCANIIPNDMLFANPRRSEWRGACGLCRSRRCP